MGKYLYLNTILKVEQDSLISAIGIEITSEWEVVVDGEVVEEVEEEVDGQKWIG